MTILSRLLTLIGALTVAGTIAAAVIFFTAPTLLQQEDPLQKADAIVVLGGQYYRPIYAAELYHRGLAPQLLVSRPVVLPEEKEVRALIGSYPYQWEVMRDILLSRGVPEKRISFFGRSNVSTVEEAAELKKVLGPEIRSIILVTSPLHTMRAGIIFRETLPPDLKIMVTGTPYDDIPEEWWHNFRTAPFVVLEVAKTLYYKLGGAFISSEQLND